MRPQRCLVLITAAALMTVACTTSPAEPATTTATSGTTSSTGSSTVSPTVTQSTTTSPGTTTTQPQPTTLQPSTSTSTTTATSTSTTMTPTTPPDTTPPRLEVTYPTHGAIVTEEVIEFRGMSEPGAQVFSGRYAADVNADGIWSLVLVLAPGDNGAAITARDAAGNATTERLVVTLNQCQDMTPAVIPESATYLSSVSGDLDGNGIDDTVTVYFDTVDETQWVHMALDYGYAASVLIEDAQVYYPEAILTVNLGASNCVGPHPCRRRGDKRDL